MFLVIVKSMFPFGKVSRSMCQTKIDITQSWGPSEIKIKKLESCWHGFLRRMVKGGFRNKPTEPANDPNFSLVYTNDDILRITNCHPLREFINTQYLIYIAHVCRRPDTNLTKLSVFYTPKASYYRDPWINISSLLGDISIEQAKTSFIRLLHTPL